MNARTPWWMTLVIIVAALPLFSFPSLLGSCPGELRPMLWVYPVYEAAGAWLAWQCYPQRRALSWILVAVLVLSHGAVWLMCSRPLSA